MKNDKLLFQGSITDGEKNIQLISFKLIECDKDSPLECIEKLTQLILGFLITEENKILSLQEEFPPKFEAYKYLLDAKENITNPNLYVDLLNKSIAFDSNYFEPKVLRVAHYYNTGDFKKADSLLKIITPTSFTNHRQQNLLNMYEVLLKGTNDKVYYYLQKEYSITPFDLLSNESYMAVALQFVNKPKDVGKIYKEISMKGMAIENCTYCEYRIYVKALSEIELGNYNSAIDLLNDINEKVDKVKLKKPLFTAFIRSKDYLKVDAFISKFELSSSLEDIQVLYLHIAKEYLLVNLKEKSTVYFNKLIASCNKNNEFGNLALAYFYSENFDKSVILLQKNLIKNPNNINLLSKLASSQFKIGKTAESNTTLNKLKSLESAYQYGAIDYALAQYFAIVGDKKQVIEQLLKAVAQGNLFTTTSYMNDPLFIPYFQNKKFKEVLNFWH